MNKSMTFMHNRKIFARMFGLSEHSHHEKKVNLSEPDKFTFRKSVILQ